MDGKRLIEKIKLRNILSFGDKGEEIELQPLNIIIGQNASGKSNLVDVIKLLNALPEEKSLSDFFNKNGGINEWIWKGTKTNNHLEVIITVEADNAQTLNYQLILDSLEQRVIIVDENIIEREKTVKNRVQYIDSANNNYLGKSFFTAKNIDLFDFINFFLPFIHIFQKIRTFTDLNTNRKSEIRKPQLPDAPNEFLEEDASNLSIVLNDFEFRGAVKDKIIENLKKFNPQVKDYSVRILGGTVQLFIREEGLEKPISAMRLSDGTLRYLCLLAILCHPEPPPLICIEEPETGLHPDILPTIAELMIEASARTQLIVTTHSDILVSSFSEIPEAVLVCEKDEDGTHFKRLEADKLKVWLEEYTLGEVWMRGGIGGTRW